MNYIISASTDIGNTKKTNQDSLNVKVITIGGEQVAFAVLCDGMGGLEKGELASASVVHAYEKWVLERLPALLSAGLRDDILRKEWEGIAGLCNEKIKDYGRRSAISLGTTAAVLLLTRERYYIMNVGDSRVYEIAGRLSVLTRDQTVVAREVEQGLLSLEQARSDPRRSVLLQCIGSSEEVYPDFFFGEPKAGAVYMLCSDGFRHEITEAEIWEGFQPQTMLRAEQMKENELRLIALNKLRQERDNISVITIRTY